MSLHIQLPQLSVPQSSDPSRRIIVTVLCEVAYATNTTAAQRHTTQSTQQQHRTATLALCRRMSPVSGHAGRKEKKTGQQRSLLGHRSRPEALVREGCRHATDLPSHTTSLPASLPLSASTLLIPPFPRAVVRHSDRS
ncbi:hypothetical protein EYF80_025009 [Liparis tanakae]|uniref:Uncharacterized protein n=1 Tax=Liparis tanakae TaxID=230148 RepID=A0A4Z2HIQ3_9TELE|nr:hypothetical protein EYF80_025009 [Liparis tanakae]